MANNAGRRKRPNVACFVLSEKFFLAGKFSAIQALTSDYTLSIDCPKYEWHTLGHTHKLTLC
jgi:hypothetical protein